MKSLTHILPSERRTSGIMNPDRPSQDSGGHRALSGQVGLTKKTPAPCAGGGKRLNAGRSGRIASNPLVNKENRCLYRVGICAVSRRYFGPHSRSLTGRAVRNVQNVREFRTVSFCEQPGLAEIFTRLSCPSPSGCPGKDFAEVAPRQIFGINPEFRHAAITKFEVEATVAVEAQKANARAGG